MHSLCLPHNSWSGRWPLQLLQRYTQNCLRAKKKRNCNTVFKLNNIKTLVLFGPTNFGPFWSNFEPDANQPLMTSNQESWHLVNECVISPLHSSLEVTSEDAVSRISQVDSGHLKALSHSIFSFSSSKRRRDAKIKASMASLQAKKLAE